MSESVPCMPLVDLSSTGITLSSFSIIPCLAHKSHSPIGKAVCFIIEANRMNPVRQGREIFRFFIAAI